MKKMRRILLLVSIISFMVFTQITPAFASWDSGSVKKINASSLYMRSSYSTSSSIIMTMANNEAVVYTRDFIQNEGYLWHSFMGWKSSTGSVVNGWAAASTLSSPISYNVLPILNPSAKWDLSIWADDTDNWYIQDLPAGSALNNISYGGDLPSYGNMVYVQVYNWTTPDGANHWIPGRSYGFVHTMFHSNSPSDYYIAY